MIAGGRWRAWILTGAVLVVGLAITATATVGFSQSLERDRQQRFDAAAERARGTIAGRLDLHVGNLTQLRNWMLIDPTVTRERFHELTSRGFEDGLYLGAQAVSFAPRVHVSDLEPFEASARAGVAGAEGYPPFVVSPAIRDNRAYPDAYVVTYIEPIAGNEEALGFDLASDPPRREAIEAARDRGTAVGSAPVRLVQDPAHRDGFVLWSPIYDTGDVPNTAPARRRHFVGVVSMVFRVGDMFAGVLGTDPEVEAEIYDLGPTADLPAARFDDTTRLLDTDPTMQVSSDGRASGLHRDLDLNIGDRRWRMVVTPSVGFAERRSAMPAIVAMLGVLVSLLLAGIVRTTTEARGRAERRALDMTADLRAAEGRSQSTLLGAPDAMLVVDGNGEILSVNLATEALFGYAAGDVEGQPIELLLPEALGELHRQHRAGFVKAPRRREMGAELELLGRRHDGATFPLEVSLSPLVGPDGSLEVIAAVRDVSERRKAQAALQAAYDREREAADQLREADELKTTFLNTVSHELRTPLTAISGFTDLLLMPTLSQDQRDEYLRRVRRNAHSLNSLIGELLAFARLDGQDVALNPNRLDLSAEVTLIVEQLSPVLDGHRIDVVAPEPVFVLVDPEALARIITNLLTNVARYAPADTSVTVTVTHADHLATVAVSDEGPGIPIHEQDRVFERFFRGATALASRVPGTGIGLAVVSELAARSGGSARVRTADGGGARFEVDLPTIEE